MTTEISNRIEVRNCPICKRCPNYIIDTVIEPNENDVRTVHNVLLCGDKVDRVKYHLSFSDTAPPSWVLCTFRVKR